MTLYTHVWNACMCASVCSMKTEDYLIFFFSFLLDSHLVIYNTCSMYLNLQWYHSHQQVMNDI